MIGSEFWENDDWTPDVLTRQSGRLAAGLAAKNWTGPLLRQFLSFHCQESTGAGNRASPRKGIIHNGQRRLNVKRSWQLEEAREGEKMGEVARSSWWERTNGRRRTSRDAPFWLLSTDSPISSRSLQNDAHVWLSSLLEIAAALASQLLSLR